MQYRFWRKSPEQVEYNNELVRCQKPLHRAPELIGPMIDTNRRDVMIIHEQR